MGTQGAAEGWTSNLDAALMIGHDKGMSIAELAATLGRPEADVLARLDAFGRLTAGDALTTPISSVLPRIELPRDLRNG